MMTVLADVRQWLKVPMRVNYRLAVCWSRRINPHLVRGRQPLD
jgi:hypothetical protein